MLGKQNKTRLGGLLRAAIAEPFAHVAKVRLAQEPAISHTLAPPMRVYFFITRQCGLLRAAYIYTRMKINKTSRATKRKIWENRRLEKSAGMRVLRK